MVTIHLVRNSEACWRLMPIALERIKAFCAKYPNDGSPEVICDQLAKSFTSDSPNLMCFLIIDEADARVTGHFLAGFDDWLGTKFLSILQYEGEKGVSRKVVFDAMEQMQRWGRAMGCTQWRAITRNRTLARVFQIYYGFRETGTLIEKKFSPLTDTEALPTPPPEATIPKNQGDQ